MNIKLRPCLEFVWRATAIHMITYFAVGILAMNVLDYENLFVNEHLKGFMRPTGDPVTALGPGLQLIRGLIFGLVLWPFSEVFLNRKAGWLPLWLLLAGLGIFSTFGPAIGSVDGMIYTLIPVREQLVYLPELLLQSFLLALLLWLWYRKPHIAWNILAGLLLALILFLSLVGYLYLKASS